jgi:hypothetical protein
VIAGSQSKQVQILFKNTLCRKLRFVFMLHASCDSLSDGARYRDLMFSFTFHGSEGLSIIGEVQVWQRAVMQG